jgi:tetratricopeptide (TPR) repeat protein
MEHEDYRLNEAVDSYNNGNYRQAIDILVASNVHKMNAAGYYELIGYCYYHLELFDNAAWYLKKSLACNPDNYLLHDWLGLTYTRLGQDKKALKEILYLYNNYPKNDFFTYRYAYFELIHERFDTALPLMLEAFSLNPNVHEDMHFYIGICYYQLEKDKEAITYLEKHAELKPEFPDTYYLLGCAVDKLGDTYAGINYLSRALWYKEDFGDALFNRFRMKKDIGDYDGAEKDLIKLLEMNPDYIQLKNNEGQQLRVTNIKIDRSNGNINLMVDSENPLG